MGILQRQYILIRVSAFRYYFAERKKVQIYIHTNIFFYIRLLFTAIFFNREFFSRRRLYTVPALSTFAEFKNTHVMNPIGIVTCCEYAIEMTKGETSTAVSSIGSAHLSDRDVVGRDLDAIIIRFSPFVVPLQSGYQLSNPLISVHSIYVRLSKLMDRRGDNDLPV